MGIRYLNRFLRLNCKNNIKLINLEDLSNKTVVVDTSVYLYRFQYEGGVIDGIYQMITLFRYNNIKLLFVFDGKPPCEKEELLKKRREEKQIAEKKYKELEKTLKKLKSVEEKNDIENEMDALRKSFVRITQMDIDNVKKLINLSGLTYYVANGESDYLCAKLVKDKKAWACLSEDMDMFVYGCPRVLRYLSLLKSKVVLYRFKGILKDLGLTHKEFKEICVLAGTDYNMCQQESNNFTLNKSLILFSKYSKKNDDTQSFYQWLMKKKIITSDELTKLNEICKMFDDKPDETCDKMYISTMFDKKELNNFLEDYDFVFV
jgi:flap endonuclease-1